MEGEDGLTRSASVQAAAALSCRLNPARDSATRDPATAD